MTFTYKVSRRLGLLRDAAIITPLAVVASCVFRTVEPSSLDVAEVLVVPGSTTLEPNQSYQFAAYGRTNTGDSVAVAVVWSTTGGTISSIGGYVADSLEGDYEARATLAGAGADASASSGSSFVRVRAPAPVASVSVSPASATLSIGAAQQLSAVAKDSAGNTLTGRVVTWSSSDPAVATVSGSGLVTAIAAGSATITATSEGKNGTSAITVQASPPPPEARVGYYVAPTGSPTGDGSASRPWDLATALAHPVAVQPGDTIWLRGGTYSGTFTSSLTGTPAKPIIVRQYPNERAIIDGYLKLPAASGSDTWYWGFEITRSTGFADTQGAEVRSPRTKLINLVIHDHEGTGIGFWDQATDAELYGVIIYNNGRQTQIPGLSHGIYTHNPGPATKLISDCILFHNLGYDLHVYGTNADIVNMTFEGNIGINWGGSHHVGGLVLRTDNARPHENITFLRNMVHGSRTSGWAVVGPNSPQALGRLSLIDNYVWAGITQLQYWSNLTVTGNTFATRGLRLFVQSGYPTSPAYVFNNNSYFVMTTDSPSHFITRIDGVPHLGTDLAGWRAGTGYDLTSTLVTSVTGKPTTNRVFVRANKYERGRANIAIFNWQNLGSVSVDVSAVLSPGDQYQVRNVQNFFGTPSVSGTYAGGSIPIPMAGVTPTAPLGGWPKGPPAVTGPEFNVFVLLRTSP
jgi:hypothetical protein